MFSLCKEFTEVVFSEFLKERIRTERNSTCLTTNDFWNGGLFLVMLCECHATFIVLVPFVYIFYLVSSFWTTDSHISNTATADVLHTLQNLDSSSALYMYTDDVVIGVKDKTNLQESFNNLIQQVEENKLKINEGKAAQMVFSKCGRMSTEEIRSVENKMLFKCLGMFLHTSGTSSKEHIQEWATAALRTMHDLSSIKLLSLETSMVLFAANIMPVLTYRINIIWNLLTESDLISIGNVKAKFFGTNTLHFKFDTLLTDIWASQGDLSYGWSENHFLLQWTGTTAWYLEKWTKKSAAIWKDSYITDAMTNQKWWEQILNWFYYQRKNFHFPNGMSHILK